MIPWQDTTNTIDNINNFNAYNKTYNKLRRKAKVSYYSKKFSDFSDNMKGTWNTIREVLGTQKRKENIPDFF